MDQPWLEQRLYWLTEVWRHVLWPDAERALKPMQTFRECTGCPELVVLPPGKFVMGSLPEENHSDEAPQHEVNIGRQFAVSTHDVTSDQWDL